MTDKSLEELRETFSYYDKDGNGTIDREEFGALLKALGCDCSDDEMAAGLDILDSDHNGLIDFEEFVSWFNDRD